MDNCELYTTISPIGIKFFKKKIIECDLKNMTATYVYEECNEEEYKEIEKEGIELYKKIFSGKKIVLGKDDSHLPYII